MIGIGIGYTGDDLKKRIDEAELERERQRASRRKVGTSNFGCSISRRPGTCRLLHNNGAPMRSGKPLSRRDERRAAAKSHQSKKGCAS